MSKITQMWNPELGAGGSPKYWLRPESEAINAILGEDSGIRLLVEIEYTKSDKPDVKNYMTVEFDQSYLKQFIEKYSENYGLYVALSGTTGISSIKARTVLTADKCNFSIASEAASTSRS